VHNNYFFLKKLSEALDTRVVGGTIETVYSQNRNELIFECLTAHSDVLIIRASVDPAFPCLSFPGQMHRARKNSVDIFGELIGARITAVVQVEYDRSFYIETGNGYKVLFKMHGNRSNILLFEGDRCIKIFRNKLKSDRGLHIGDLQGRADLSREAFFRAGGIYRKLAPVFGNALETYFGEHAYGDQDIEQQWELFSGLMQHFQDPDYCISNDKGIPVFRLYRDTATVYCTDNPFDGINRFYTDYTRTRHLMAVRSDAVAYITAALTKTRGYLEKARQKLEQLRHGRRYDQWADIIMANLHHIPKYSDHAVLYDFYNDREVAIPLKKQWTPQENAAYYYRKSKNQAMETRRLSENIEARESTRLKLESALQAIGPMSHAKDIQAYMKPLRTDTAMAPDDAATFHRYTVEGWDILAGKNNRTNELLTFGMANKNDYWLHVKDAPGAHVVVRKPGNMNAPKHVLQHAASLAALHSKRSTEALCPVTLTQKKFVRKGKGMKPGQVLVDREEVLLVAPARRG
jgi:predicted ribosome quality control (RQC) complex YloA/Tae2 family protein